jgi:hypothetical protein
MDAVKLETVERLLEGIKMEKISIGGFPGQLRFMVGAEDPLQTLNLMKLVSLIPNMVETIRELGKSLDERDETIVALQADQGKPFVGAVVVEPEAFTRVEIKLPGKIEDEEMKSQAFTVGELLGAGYREGQLFTPNGMGFNRLAVPGKRAEYRPREVEGGAEMAARMKAAASACGVEIE